MGLILKVAHASTSSDCATMTINHTTGDYAATNLGGFGSPNPTRASQYLKLFVTLKTSNGDETIALDAYTENTIESWDVDIASDGYYEVYLFACEAYSTGVTYGVGDIAYDAGTDTYYKSLLASNLNFALTNTTYWEEATLIATFKAAVALYEAGTTDVVYYEAIDDTTVLCNSKKCRAKFYADSCCGKCSDLKFDQADRLIRAVEAADELGAYASAQKGIEDLQNICDCIDE